MLGNRRLVSIHGPDRDFIRHQKSYGTLTARDRKSRVRNAGTKTATGVLLNFERMLCMGSSYLPVHLLATVSCY